MAKADSRSARGYEIGDDRSGKANAEEAFMRLIAALTLLSTLAGCTTSEATAERRRADRHRHNIELMLGEAVAEAMKACGGRPVRMVVEGDQADKGYSASDYQCAD